MTASVRARPTVASGFTLIESMIALAIFSSRCPRRSTPRTGAGTSRPPASRATAASRACTPTGSAAVIYTNHSFCWLVLGSAAAQINGALVSRNENVIYGTPLLECNHDSRRLGGSSGLASGLLPVAVQPAEVLRWEQLDRDPNRNLVAL